MPGLKRLYMLMLRTFLPLFLMTFLIVLFIVLMQFLWRYIDDLVGKGLSVDVLGELFFYAALTMIPMALPLAILLASLMTFGNLGENFELTAIKAGGVSLLKAMRPLIILMVLVAVGAFFFQNNVLPVAQTKMWTLLFSVRQKSPELEIPQGVFYDQIPGINLFVKSKDRDTGTLRDVMIYDMSKGFDNARVILADSGRLASTDDNAHLFLQLWQGELFENVAETQMSMRNVPYRRESFDVKELMIAFDANFNRLDEEGMRNQYVGKDMAQLQATIDSVGQRVDSIGGIYAAELLSRDYLGVEQASRRTGPGAATRPVRHAQPQPGAAATPMAGRTLDIDSVFRGSSSSGAVAALNAALSKARRDRQDYEFKSYAMKDDRKVIRRHAIELQKKFTLSFACIIFFFIGAPLGAIIRKGGLGTPLVISVLLFIVYYIIDNTGYKMARDGKLEVWQGMWLSAAILAPLGVILTWKAMNDSDVFNADAWGIAWRRFTGTHEVRSLQMKEVVIDEVDPAEGRRRLEALARACAALQAGAREPFSYRRFWTHGLQPRRLEALEQQLEDTVAYLSNSRSKLVVNKLMDYPVLRNLWIYNPRRTPRAATLLMWAAPLGAPVYLLARRYRKALLAEIAQIAAVTAELLGKSEFGLGPDGPLASDPSTPTLTSPH